MTEKRFTVCTFPKGSFENVLEDNLTGDAFQFTNEYHRSICELLNKLNDENEQLKQFIQSLAEQSVNGKVMLRDGKVYDLNKILKKEEQEND